MITQLEPFDALLATRGWELERAVLRAGVRGIGVATNAGRRALVTVVGPDVDPAALPERPGWDLPLVSAVPVETDGGPRTMLVEALPIGVPSTWLETAGSFGAGRDRVPPFALGFAQAVAATHAAGELVGRLQPELVLVDPVSLELIGCAQRPLRADAGAAPIDGAPRFRGAAYLTPAELEAGKPEAPDDCFRLAAFVWRWRHGADPFAGEIQDRLAWTAAGTPEGATADASDPIDGVLLRAFAPDPGRRASASEIAAALAAGPDSWSPAKGS